MSEKSWKVSDNKIGGGSSNEKSWKKPKNNGKDGWEGFGPREY